MDWCKHFCVNTLFIKFLKKLNFRVSRWRYHLRDNNINNNETKISQLIFVINFCLDKEKCIKIYNLYKINF